jgi:uncharacterized RDD family membrane protein YckC
MDAPEELEANRCTVHPGNPADQVCGRCGNFMCRLCAIHVGTMRVCPACFNRLYEKDEVFVRYAGFGERLGALVIDWVLFFVVSLFFNLIFQVALFSRGSEGELGILLFFMAMLGLWSFYNVAMWTLTGATIGKRALGIKVVGPDHKPPSLPRSLARYAMYWVSTAFFLLGFFWAAWEPKHRAWHDLAAGTEVIVAHKK